MNRFQNKKFQKSRTRWSDHVESFNWMKMPNELKNFFSDEEFNTFVSLPFVRIEELNEILINESFDDWECIRDILSAIDMFPSSLLSDIYKMDFNDRKHIKISGIAGKDDDDTIRNLIFVLIPEIMWARGENITEKPAII